MRRRSLLGSAGAVLTAPWMPPAHLTRAAEPVVSHPFRRCRPGDPAWPTDAMWEALGQQVGGRLRKLHSSFAAVDGAEPDSAALHDLLRNPFYRGDQPSLTQASGWIDAWTSVLSAYAVIAQNTADVVAAVNFARENRLRLVIKGGGHSYQGTSSAPDSLLIWTRHMSDVTLHDAFVGQGCEAAHQPRSAVSIGAGAIWMQVYDAVVVKGGSYVQGGGCTTVGVAGLIQGGGFGSFSKRFGLAAGSLLEAEVVTADGIVRVANACTHPDLFWALKGGGGGTFGVVTRLTLARRDLPATFGGVSGAVRATSDDAFHQLVKEFLGFYADALFNPQWGETATFGRDRTLTVSMVFQGLEQHEAENTWQAFVTRLQASSERYVITTPFRIQTLPARRLWDGGWLGQHAPGLVICDRRTDAIPGSFVWAGDVGQTGQCLHAYDSAWLPAALLAQRDREVLCEALVTATLHWNISLHFNKGLAGAPQQVIAEARDTAINPAALDAFALAISGAHGPFAYPGSAEPDLVQARANASQVTAAFGALSTIGPDLGAYVSESNFFDPRWQQRFWGSNWSRLSAVKQRYDPRGLFFVHHGVGSEQWDPDGFGRSG